MRVLTESAGFVLYEDGGRLVFVDRGTGWTFWLRFVLGLVTVIVGLNGVAQIALGLTGAGSVVVGAVLLAVSGLAGAAFFAVFAWVRARAKLPLADHRPLVVVDLPRGVLLGPSGEQLAPLAHVTFARELQLTSSAPALVCRWPGGKTVVHRGGAMGLTGVGHVLEVLRQYGLHS